MVFYIYAVIGTNLFSATYPEYYGDLQSSMFTLFQIMTLESWASAIARPVMDGVPFAGIYFVYFILIATYTTLNIFIAIVVNTMSDISLADLKEEEEIIKSFILKENQQLHMKLDSLMNRLNQQEREQLLKDKPPVSTSLQQKSQFHSDKSKVEY